MTDLQKRLRGEVYEPRWFNLILEAADRIDALEAERDALKVEVDKAYREGWLDGYAKRPQRLPRAIVETEK